MARHKWGKARIIFFVFYGSNILISCKCFPWVLVSDGCLLLHVFSLLHLHTHIYTDEYTSLPFILSYPPPTLSSTETLSLQILFQLSCLVCERDSQILNRVACMGVGRRPFLNHGQLNHSYSTEENGIHHHPIHTSSHHYRSVVPKPSCFLDGMLIGSTLCRQPKLLAIRE